MLAVSVDPAHRNKKFAEAAKLGFPILSDAHREVSKLYGVLSIFRIAGRTTFVIDLQGIIRHVDTGRAALNPANALNACQAI